MALLHHRGHREHRGHAQIANGSILPTFESAARSNQTTLLPTVAIPGVSSHPAAATIPIISARPAWAGRVKLQGRAIGPVKADREPNTSLGQQPHDRSGKLQTLRRFPHEKAAEHVDLEPLLQANPNLQIRGQARSHARSLILQGVVRPTARLQAPHACFPMTA